MRLLKQLFGEAHKKRAYLDTLFSMVFYVHVPVMGSLTAVKLQRAVRYLDAFEIMQPS